MPDTPTNVCSDCGLDHSTGGEALDCDLRVTDGHMNDVVTLRWRVDNARANHRPEHGPQPLLLISADEGDAILALVRASEQVQCCLDREHDQEAGKPVPTVDDMWGRFDEAVAAVRGLRSV